MSEAPRQMDTDLHAAFGMDGGSDVDVDPVIEVERTVATEVEVEDVEAERYVEAGSPDGGEWTGITTPSRRGS